MRSPEAADLADEGALDDRPRRRSAGAAIAEVAARLEEARELAEALDAPDPARHEDVRALVDAYGASLEETVATKCSLGRCSPPWPLSPTCTATPSAS